MDDHQRPCRRCGRTVHTELFLAQTRPLVGLTHRATHCLLLGWAGTSVSGKKCLRWQRLALLQRGFCFCPQGPFWPHPTPQGKETMGLRGYDPQSPQPPESKSLLQHHNSKASVLRHSAFFMDQLSYPYLTTGKTTALTRWAFVNSDVSAF